MYVLVSPYNRIPTEENVANLQQLEKVEYSIQFVYGLSEFNLQTLKKQCLCFVPLIETRH